MGFLQGDTNNLILDAVLTDKGREFLARNDGSFSIQKFAPADDEIDYSLIQKFGRTVGKEKIEKNTPIFEGLTNGSLAQKYRLVSVSNPNLIRLPTLSLTGEIADSTGTLVQIGTTSVKSRRLTVSQTNQNGEAIDVELQDQSFIVEMSNLFLEIAGVRSETVDSQQRATYILTRDSDTTGTSGAQLTFTIQTKLISQSQFQIFGSIANKDIISTFVRISGIQSGGVYEFEVQINKNT